jgi:flagellar basal-body rod protein FlgB
MINFASDPVESVLHSALNGLSYRQQVASNNIANVDTPGFTASKVDFEDSLRSAVQDGDVTGSGTVQASTSQTGATAGADGNNVDLARETMVQMQASFSYQLLSRAVGDRFAMISTAIGGM